MLPVKLTGTHNTSTFIINRPLLSKIGKAINEFQKSQVVDTSFYNPHLTLHRR